MEAYSHTSQAFTPSDFGMNLLGSNTFPQIEMTTSDPTIANGLQFGSSVSFGNAGMYQNQWEYGTHAELGEGQAHSCFR